MIGEAIAPADVGIEFDEVPLDDTFIVLPDEPEEVTQAGVYIAEQSRERKRTGTIIAVGPEVKEPLGKGVRVRMTGIPMVVIDLDDGRQAYIVNRTDIATVLRSISS